MIMRNSRKCPSCMNGIMSMGNIKGKTYYYKGQKIVIKVNIEMMVCPLCDEISFSRKYKDAKRFDEACEASL